MIIRKCDRCGNKIDQNYWTIQIYQREDNLGRVSIAGATNNTEENNRLLTNNQKEYCINCINDIKAFINKCTEREEK